MFVSFTEILQVNRVVTVTITCDSFTCLKIMCSSVVVKNSQTQTEFYQVNINNRMWCSDKELITVQ